MNKKIRTTIPRFLEPGQHFVDPSGWPNWTIKSIKVLPPAPGQTRSRYKITVLEQKQTFFIFGVRTKVILADKSSWNRSGYEFVNGKWVVKNTTTKDKTMTDMYVPQKPKNTIVNIENSGKVRITYADGHAGYLNFPEAIDLCRALVHAILDYSVEGSNKKIVKQCEVL